MIGYDPTNTKSGRVPIVSAYLKSALSNGTFVLLVVNEAPYLAHSTTNLLSEYQIREYGKVIDSCSKSHVLSSDPLILGKQRFELGSDQHIDLINRGGIMGLPLFPYIEGDDKLYEKIVITSDEPWIPRQHRRNLQDSLDTSSEPSILAQTVSSTVPLPPTPAPLDFHLGRV